MNRLRKIICFLMLFGVIPIAQAMDSGCLGSAWNVSDVRPCLFCLAEFLNAARTGDLAIVQAHLRDGIDINTHDREGWTALIFAACAGHVEVVQALLAHVGLDHRPDVAINACDVDGWTALMCAVRSRHRLVVQLFLGHRDGNNHFDVAVNTRTRNRTTALDYAEPGSEIERLLIARGAKRFSEL